MDKNQLALLDEFMSRTKGHVETIENKHWYDSSMPRGFLEPGTATYQASVAVRQRLEVKLTCDLEMLLIELERVREFREMMFYPDTRQLIEEAKFIHALKGRRYDNEM